jgi:hypothetical protein
MALFARICVLRGFPAAAYREVAFLSRYVCGNRKPLCLPREMRSLFNWGGLDPNKKLLIYELETQRAQVLGSEFKGCNRLKLLKI